MRRVSRFSVAVSAFGSIGLWGSRMGVVGEGAIQEEGALQVCEPEVWLGASKVDIAPRLERRWNYIGDCLVFPRCPVA